MIPIWLTDLSTVFIVAGVLCAIVIAWDEFHHPQRMGVMNIVWPVVALFGTAIAIGGYLRYGRLSTRSAMLNATKGDKAPSAKGEMPFAVMVAKGSSHCGAGCTLGDIVAEWLAFAVPSLAVWLGWKTLFVDKMFAVWILDFIFAFVIGIAFQYFTIAPMRGLGFRDGILAALKADTLSLISWQVGMYGFMAFAKFYLFATLMGVALEVNSVAFWFMMQIAMLCGFMTSYPINWWLLRAGFKEKM